MTLDVKFEEQDQTFNTNFGEVQTVGGGENGATFIPNVSQSGVISWTNDKGLENPTPVNIKGAKGDKGDRGEQGIQGIQGAKGTDGVNGKDGANGQDGFSPIVAVTDIEGGHKVTITDKNGAKTFEVMDGKDGQGGSGGSVQADWSQSDSTAQDYIKNRPFYVDYAYEPLVYQVPALVGSEHIDLTMYDLGFAIKISSEDFPIDEETILSSKFDKHKIPYVHSYSSISLDTDLEQLGLKGYKFIHFNNMGEDECYFSIVYLPIAGDINIGGSIITVPSVGLYVLTDSLENINGFFMCVYKRTIHKISSIYEPPMLHYLSIGYNGIWRVFLYGDAIEDFKNCTEFEVNVGNESIKFTKTSDENIYAIGFNFGNGTFYVYRANISGAFNEITIYKEEIPTKSQVQTMIDNAIANLPIYNGEVEEV